MIRIGNFRIEGHVNSNRVEVLPVLSVEWMRRQFVSVSFAHGPIAASVSHYPNGSVFHLMEKVADEIDRRYKDE